jgi:hypothetical protein
MMKMNSLKKTALMLLTLASLAMGYALIVPVSAQSHDQICLDNYNRCVKACDGAEGCTKQCKANYDGCVGR